MIGLILETNRMIGFNPGKGGGSGERMRGETARQEGYIYTCTYACIYLPRLVHSFRGSLYAHRATILLLHAQGHVYISSVAGANTFVRTLGV